MNGSEKLDNSIKNVNSSKESIWRVCFLNKNKALSGVWKEIAFKKR
jgi:predicted acetyltransferase